MCIVHFPYCIINIVSYHFNVFQAHFSTYTVLFKIYCRRILNNPRKSQCHMLNWLFAIFLAGCCNPFNVLYCTSFNKQRKQDVFWVLIIAKSLVEVELKWVSKIKVKRYDKRDRMIKRMRVTGSELHLYRTEIDRIKILLLTKRWTPHVTVAMLKTNCTLCQATESWSVSAKTKPLYPLKVTRRLRV